MAEAPRKPRSAVEPDTHGSAAFSRRSQPVDVEVRWRLDDETERQGPWLNATAGELAAATPWRTFRWYKGQRHYSGQYWSATTGHHVQYESRLELARLLYADFDPAVTGIVSQPFLLSAVVDGQRRKHVPDYLLACTDGPVVVDVKPRAKLDHPKVAPTLAWARNVVESRGWRFEVACEPPEQQLSNIRFLAGYRRDNLLAPGLLDDLRAIDLAGLTIAEAVARAAVALPAQDPALIRAAVFHLLWRQAYRVDLDTVLSSRHLVGAAS